MKIAFVFGDWVLGGRWIDFNDIWNSSRGLTGSEISCLCYAREMARRGHDVHLFIANTSNSPVWEGVHLHHSREIPNVDNSWDVAYSWLEPDILSHFSSSTLKILNQQVNDFDYAKSDFDRHVDVYTSPSQSHLEHVYKGSGVRPIATSRDKWEVLPNACDPSIYSNIPRVPGRVIYASSPDRGLHLLFQAWPKIKRSAPEAHLKIFYNLDSWLESMSSVIDHDYEWGREAGCRARYIKNALSRMQHLDVQKVGSSSRNQMAKEFSEAMVLAYPCDTLNFTEGFSVTTLEACASGTFPVISSVDSLGQVYGGVVPMVNAPAKDNLDEFVEFVVRGLKDNIYREEVISKTKAFAEKHKWSVTTDTLESIIQKRIKWNRSSR